MQPADAGDPRGRVPGLLPDADPVRGDTLARAAEHRRQRLPDDYPTPSPRPVPGVHSSPQTRSDFLPARPTLQRRREIRGKVSESKSTTFNFQLKFKESTKQIQIIQKQ